MTDTQTREARRAAEDRVIHRVLVGLIDAGHSITVSNGEDDPISDSRDAAAIASVLRQTDADTLWCSDADGVNQGFVWLVYGNDPCEVVADMTTNLEPAVSDALAYAARME